MRFCFGEQMALNWLIRRVPTEAAHHLDEKVEPNKQSDFLVVVVILLYTIFLRSFL